MDRRVLIVLAALLVAARQIAADGQGFGNWNSGRATFYGATIQA